MEDSSSAIPDWAHLPQLVVHLISQKVKCITDYVRFRAVCSPWRAESLEKPQHRPLQLPWLMIPYSISGSPDDDGLRLFYDLWEKKIRKIRLLETIGKACCATYRGWILIVAPLGSELFLLNPLTGARVDLPPFNIPVKHILDGVEDDKPHMVDYLFQRPTRRTQSTRLTRSTFETFSITKITFSTDLTDPNCIIMVFNNRNYGIFYCKVGDPCWTQVAVRPSGHVALLEDAAYYNGCFYLYYEYEGEVVAIYNLNQHKVQGIYSFKPELEYLPKLFLVGKSGVYMVFHPTEEEYRGGDEAEEATGKSPKQNFDLYQVIGEELGMDMKWVADTSDTALFYVHDNYHYLAVCTDDWDSLDGGCMYVEDVCSSSVVNEVEPCYGIYFAKIDEGNTEPVQVGVCKMPQFFYPCSPPMWFQPNFF